MLLFGAIGLVMNFVMYWFSDRIALAAHRAQPVSRAEAPTIYAIVERLTQRAGMPMPRVYLIPSAAANAFATGRNPNHAAVAVTEGSCEILSEPQLEAVLAHELVAREESRHLDCHHRSGRGRAGLDHRACDAMGAHARRNGRTR